MKGKVFVVVLLVCVVTITHAEPTVWYVHPDSVQNCIQDCLDACADNDIVLVGPGTYYENILWPNTQGIHLISELGPETTIVDGSNASYPVIYMLTTVDTTTVIHGFTLQHGICGFAFDWYSNSSPTITRNIIVNNVANEMATWGGGICCHAGCSPIISYNTIENNELYGWYGASGGGIFCDSNSAIIIGNTITNNSAEAAWGSGGGGIWCSWFTGIIIGNTISGNSAGFGGGIACFSSSSPTISYNNISENTAGDGIFCSHGSSPMISYNDIYSNSGCGVYNDDTTVVVNAEYNWWGDSTGPYHPDSNSGGQGDTVSDYVDFIPWLYWPGVEEQLVTKHVVKHNRISSTIFSGPLVLPEGKNCKVFDITGRVVVPDNIRPGIYFIEIDGEVTQKVVKIK